MIHWGFAIVSILDLVAISYHKIPTSHCTGLHRKHQNCARYIAWKSIKVLGRPSGTIKLHAKQSEDNAGSVTLIQCSARIIHNVRGLCFPSVEKTGRREHPILNHGHLCRGV